MKINSAPTWIFHVSIILHFDYDQRVFGDREHTLAEDRPVLATGVVDVNAVKLHPSSRYCNDRMIVILQCNLLFAT